MQMPVMYENIIDLQKIENNNKFPNDFFMCTKNGLYILTITQGRNMMKFEITNGEEPDE